MIITEVLKLLENIQLADKIYFNTGLLDDNDKKLLISITHGDNYSKIMADIIYLYKQDNYHRSKEVSNLTKYYNIIKNYNNNVFPIYDLDILSQDVESISNILKCLDLREAIIKMLRELPSVLTRNLKQEIREVRKYSQLYNYHDKLQYFTAQFTLLSNKPENIKQKLYQKMFKSGTTLDDLLDFVEDKQNLIIGNNLTIEELKTTVKENPDLEIIYNNNNYVIVRVTSAEAIKTIGCNSLWCFTYGEYSRAAQKQWEEFSTNDIVYVIFNFNIDQEDTRFMVVVIKPIDFEAEDSEDSDEYSVYELTNEPIFSVLDFFENTIGIEVAKEYLTFDENQED